MYKCGNCSYSSPKKLGKCPNCSEFGSFIEDQKEVKSTKKGLIGRTLEGQKSSEIKFYGLGEKEYKRVLERGIKNGGIYLMGGEPGIGKSTIVLQIMDDLASNNEDINFIYFSGEENVDQIRDRQKRLSLNMDNLDIYATNSLEDIIVTCETSRPDIIIIDSIQTIHSANIDSVAGSINQVKYCSEKLSEFCRANSIACIIIGHVTKGGEIAGPKYLEHIVDVVLQIYGDRYGQYRFLRSIKNRFGSTDDVGIFEMSLFGMKPVYDIKQRILDSAKTSIPGSVLSIGIDGQRSVILALEVLLNKTKYKFPQRTSIGIENNRLDLVIAILERYLKLNVGFFDIYVNIPGEIKLYDSGLDLALAAAILGQYKNKVIDKNLVFLGELGLGGQVLKTKLHEKRLKEIPEGFDVIDYNRIKNVVELLNLI